MAINLHDQPSKPYMDYDVTDYTGENYPIIPTARGFGWPEAFAIVLVGLMLTPVVSWVALRIAEALA